MFDIVNRSPPLRRLKRLTAALMPLVMLVMLGLGSMASVAHAHGEHHGVGKPVTGKLAADKVGHADLTMCDAVLVQIGLLLDGSSDASLQHGQCSDPASVGQERCADIFCQGAIVLPLHYKADPVLPPSVPAPGRIDCIDGMRLEALDRPPCSFVSV